MDRDQLSAAGLHFLSKLARIPAVPYYEQAVAAYIQAACADAGLETRSDRYGNVLATRPGSEDGASGIAFVAHMDHPGFEALRVEDEGLVGRGLGGLPPQAFQSGTRVQLITRSGDRLAGMVVGRVGPRSEQSVLLETDRDAVGELPCAAVLDLPGYDLDPESRLIRMRAADDLAGCASVMAVLAASLDRASAGAVHGLFTRAEEVGLIGARLAAEDGLLPPDTVVVSVETSSTLPGAEIGGGPVIRTGDRMTTFDHRAEEYLLAARDEIGAAPVQRQLMSAGTCEGSAFARFGYATTGLAYPLGNWHNNGPDETVRAEFIHEEDFATGLALLDSAAALAGVTPSSKAGTRLLERPGEEERRLLESAE